MKLLIDADSAVWKAGKSNEIGSWLVIHGPTSTIDSEYKYKKDIPPSVFDDPDLLVEKHWRTKGPVGHSIHNLRKIIEDNILEAVHHTRYEMFISGDNNFRFDVYPDYKKGRADTPKPIHFHQLREYLINHYGAEVVNGEEADDAVSWRQCTDPEPTCIVTIDKDLLNTPGLNYNYDKKKLIDISVEEANLNFARQCLTGDSTDGIPGLTGVGPARANKILPRLHEGWKETILGEYVNSFGQEGESILLRNATLLWMRRREGETFSWEVV